MSNTRKCGRCRAGFASRKGGESQGPKLCEACTAAIEAEQARTVAKCAWCGTAIMEGCRVVEAETVGGERPKYHEGCAHQAQRAQRQAGKVDPHRLWGDARHRAPRPGFRS